MANSSFSRTKLAAHIAGELERGKDAKALAKSVAGYLIDFGKTSELNSLMRDVMETRADKNGYVELGASSAFPLTADQKSEIERVAKKQYKSTKNVVIHHTTDNRSIGGINVSFPHSQLDLSVRSKLNRLRSAIVK